MSIGFLFLFYIGLTLGLFGSIVISTLVIFIYRRRRASQRIRAKLVRERSIILATNSGGKSARLFSNKDMKKATNDFARDRVLGCGGFGEVYKGILDDGTEVAIKSAKIGNVKGVDQVLNEVKILSQVNHRSLVRLLGCCVDSELPLLVYEYVPNGNLFEHLNGYGDLDWKVRLQIGLQSAEGLAYLHSAAYPPIYHRDVKSSNILIDKFLNAKVADFGLSRLAEPDLSHVSTCAQGTLGYLDPEYYRNFQLTDKSDVYSFGMVLLEIVSGRKNVDVSRLVLHGDDESWYFPAFASQKFKEGQVDEILDMNLGSLSEIELAEATRVIQIAFWCIQDQPSLRPSMCKVLHMLEGFSEVRTPPLSFSFGMRFHLNNTIASAPQTPQNNGATRAMDSPNGDHQNTASPGRDVSPRRSPIPRHCRATGSRPAPARRGRPAIVRECPGRRRVRSSRASAPGSGRSRPGRSAG